MFLAFLLTHADTNYADTNYVRLAAGLTAQCIPDNHPLCPNPCQRRMKTPQKCRLKIPQVG